MRERKRLAKYLVTKKDFCMASVSRKVVNLYIYMCVCVPWQICQGEIAITFLQPIYSNPYRESEL